MIRALINDIIVNNMVKRLRKNKKIKRNFFSLLSNKIGIDLGTATTCVHLDGKGIIFSEPSYVILNKKTNTIEIIGKRAHEMLGRTPEHLKVIHPMKNGVVADFEVSEQFIKQFLIKSEKISPKILSPIVVVGVPSDVGIMDAESVKDAVMNAGAREVYIVYEPIAAALGLSLPIEKETAHMIIDIGGGTSDTVVLASNGIVASSSLTVAGDKCNEYIQKKMRTEKSIDIGLRTSEVLKVSVFSEPVGTKTKFRVHGIDISSGLPTSILVDSKDIFSFIEKPLSDIIESIREFVKKLPTEVAGDLVLSGTFLVGGGALIPGFRKKLEDKIGIKIIVPDNPIKAVVEGTVKIARNPKKYAHFFVEEVANHSKKIIDK